MQAVYNGPDRRTLRWRWRNRPRGLSMFDFQCPHCGARLHAPESAAGKSGKCKECGTLVRVPKVLLRVAAKEERIDPQVPVSAEATAIGNHERVVAALTARAEATRLKRKGARKAKTLLLAGRKLIQLRRLCSVFPWGPFFWWGSWSALFGHSSTPLGLSFPPVGGCSIRRAICF